MKNKKSFIDVNRKYLAIHGTLSYKSRTNDWFGAGTKVITSATIDEIAAYKNNVCAHREFAAIIAFQQLDAEMSL